MAFLLLAKRHSCACLGLVLIVLSRQQSHSHCKHECHSSVACLYNFLRAVKNESTYLSRDTFSSKAVSSNLARVLNRLVFRNICFSEPRLQDASFSLDNRLSVCTHCWEQYRCYSPTPGRSVLHLHCRRVGRHSQLLLHFKHGALCGRSMHHRDFECADLYYNHCHGQFNNWCYCSSCWKRRVLYCCVRPPP